MTEESQLPPEERELIGIAEAAERLNVSRQTVHKYLRTGKLTPYKVAVGNRTLVDAAEIQKLTEPRRVERSSN